MKVLVTGANGYLGQGIVKCLLDEGVEVIASDLICDKVDSRAVKINKSVFDSHDPFEEFEKPDTLLHLAWRDGFVHNSDKHLADLYSHYKFIETMIKSGLKKACCMGTMHEIGYHEGCITDDTPCNPLNLYGIAKNALRNAVKLLCEAEKTEFIWLRGFYIVGNSAFGNSIFSKIFEAEKQGQSSFPFTTGKNKYDFVDYGDFCKMVAAAVIQNDIYGIVNICTGIPESLCDRVERFISENGFNIKLEYGAYPDRKYDSPAVWGDANKINKIMKKYGR